MAPVVFGAVALAAVAAAVALTWRRLFIGMDLRDESFYVLVPWRWALGDKPFVQEENLAMVSGFVMYPFVKLFALVRDYDVTGYVLYMRHLYLLMMLAAAVAVFLLLRRLVRWELAALASAVFVTHIPWATPQLSYNTIATAFLTIAAALGAWVVVFEKGRRYALVSGAALGVAVAAYPPLLFVVPFHAVFLAFALGQRAVTLLTDGTLLPPPGPEGPPTGPATWRALSAWVLGGAVILLPLALVMFSFGPQNVLRSWDYTMAGARVIHQLGGASKALSVASGSWGFVTSQPYLIVAALVVYLVYRRRPRLGRALLAAVPLALWVAGQRPLLQASGFVQVYAFLTPYLYLFIPRERRETGARLLVWIWAPAIVAGAMTAYTSAAGYVSSAVGFAPAIIVGGLFLAWSLEAVTKDRIPWLALATLAAVAAVTVSFNFQYQSRDVPYSQLTSRFDSGPWWGIKVTPGRRRQMDAFGADLRTATTPADKLLVYFEGSGYYLYWNGAIASNTYWTGPDLKTKDLSQATIDYYRRHRLVPTVVARVLAPTTALSEEELAGAGAWLGYAVVAARPAYVISRMPPDENAGDVLDRLPRAERTP